jgi:hypothetical protein
MTWIKIASGIVAGVLWFLTVTLFAFAIMSSLRF